MEGFLGYAVDQELLIWLAAAIIASVRFRHLSLSLKVITLYLWSNAVIEGLAFILLHTIRRNLEAYNVFTFLGTILLCLYFNYSILTLKKQKIGLYVAGMSVSVGLVNLILFQPISVYGSYLLVWESIVVVSMALFAFARMLIAEPGANLKSNPHFWICAALAFYWTIMFSVLSLTGYWNSKGLSRPAYVTYCIIATNIMTSGVFFFVFLKWRKWAPLYE